MLEYLLCSNSVHRKFKYILDWRGIVKLFPALSGFDGIRTVLIDSMIAFVESTSMLNRFDLPLQVFHFGFNVLRM